MMSDKQRFACEADFAKVVTDENGEECLLIGHQIIKVNPPHMAVMLAYALRSAAQENGNTPVRVNSGISAPQVI